MRDNPYWQEDREYFWRGVRRGILYAHVVAFYGLYLWLAVFGWPQ